jgi:hypothetical protein
MFVFAFQLVLQTVKWSSFSVRLCKNRFSKNRSKSKYKHKISRIIIIVGIRRFLNPQLFKPLYLYSHVIHMILILSSQQDSQKTWSEKIEPNKQSRRHREYIFINPNQADW